jgi:hypothetical protein
MGLLEKRALKAFQDDAYKKLTSEINAVAGFNVEFEVKWETLALEEQSHLYEDSFPKVYFTPIINAFKEITADDMGKEALKETLKKIVIKNVDQIYYGDRCYFFEKGVLTIDHMPTTNIDNIQERTEGLTKILMKQM